jgi:hypothetical protein
MHTRDLIIQALQHTPDSALTEVLDFVEFINQRRREDDEDLRDAIAAIQESKTEGTVSWEKLKAEVGL